MVSASRRGGQGIVSEVTNTFGERLPYLLLPAEESSLPSERRRTWETDKRLHVSPFMPMDQSYTWWFSEPQSRIDVRMDVHHPGDRDFVATLTTRRVELTPASLRAALVRYPLMPLKVTAGIHWQAARLCPEAGAVLSQAPVRAVQGEREAVTVVGGVTRRAVFKALDSFAAASSCCGTPMVAAGRSVTGVGRPSSSMSIGRMRSGQGSAAGRAWASARPTSTAIGTATISSGSSRSSGATSRPRRAPIATPVYRGQKLRPDLSQRQTAAVARRNIHAHYDLGNDLFELMLDPTMAYSCGIWEDGSVTLEEAQRAKFRHVCDKLVLGSDDHLLEIGCGWGGLAIHAATETGCRVTGVTISPSQAALARERVRAAGVSHLVEIVEQDYRLVEGASPGSSRSR